MGKAKLIFVLILALVLGASYATGLAGKFVDITGDAVKEIFGNVEETIKEKTTDRLAAAENEAGKKLGNSIGDDSIKINLTNPLTGDKVEYTCEKGLK